MPDKPTVKRAFAFFDGQNLFHAAKKAFGCGYPDYDPTCLAREVCSQKEWILEKIYFYSGVPDKRDNPFWNHFWNAKLAVMGTRGIHTFSRSLRYRNQTVTLSDGSSVTILAGSGKRHRYPNCA